MILKQPINDSDLIQVTCTACIRPTLLEITFSSFNDGLLNQFKTKELFINIDPIGENKATVNDILKICNKYFDKVTFNTPITGDFSKAAKWAWEQVNSDYFLHLEDDWLLNKKISKDYLISTLMKDQSIASVRLNRQTSLKYKNQDKVSLNPTLFKTAFIKESLKMYDENIDPEKQFSMPPLKNLSDNYSHLVYGDKKGQYIEGAFVSDIGRYWRKSNGLDKAFEGQKFSWEICKSTISDQFKSYLFFKTLGLRRLINQLR